MAISVVEIQANLAILSTSRLHPLHLAIPKNYSESRAADIQTTRLCDYNDEVCELCIT